MKDNEEIPEDYYLKYPPEGSTGEQFTKEDVLQTLRKSVTETVHFRSKNAALVAALKELIPIAEQYALSVDNPKWEEIFRHNQSVIERAKKLIE